MLKTKVITVDTDDHTLDQVGDAVEAAINKMLDYLTTQGYEVVDFTPIAISASYDSSHDYRTRMSHESGVVVVFKYHERLL